jgi:hypothetical protein
MISGLEPDDLCGGCGIRSPDVECRGIYYCPNVLCTMSGATYLKSCLNSYRQSESGKWTVDPVELFELGERLIAKEVDQDMKVAMLKSLEIWRPFAMAGYVSLVIES